MNFLYNVHPRHCERRLSSYVLQRIETKRSNLDFKFWDCFVGKNPLLAMTEGADVLVIAAWISK